MVFHKDVLTIKQKKRKNFMRKYTAKIEWLAVKEEALKMLNQGYSYTLLHEHFVTEGKITMAYKTFYGYVRVAKASSNQSSQEKSDTPARKLGVSNGDSLIKHDSNPDLNKYI
ncbi:TraK family protein [Desulfopila sp. IMCC35006]|uniref:TraK family protein n=1 Tax=Desulfopila sp. IMCC35006 TaxID=2569542 RepID=UPI00210731F7|nr:TraK family protein [Desulfopila sp. IMCC35006]